MIVKLKPRQAKIINGARIINPTDRELRFIAEPLAGVVVMEDDPKLVRVADKGLDLKCESG